MSLLVPCSLRTLGAFRSSFAASSRIYQQQWSGFSSDSHDDFKPKIKEGGAAPSAEDQIKNDVSSHDVYIFMKGVPDAPNCGFSNMACRVLDAYGVKYGARNVLADAAIRDGIKKFSNWPTIPQIFVSGEFVGGADILMGMHESGELEKVLDPIRKKQQKAAKGK